MSDMEWSFNYKNAFNYQYNMQFHYDELGEQ